MSYYGIRKLKLVKTEAGKYNYSCECYDSSITDYKGNRIWRPMEKLFNKDYDTKEALELQMFKDVLDGNIHGAGGKYSCLSWDNRKTELSIGKQKELDRLNKIKNVMLEDYYKWINSKEVHELEKINPEKVKQSKLYIDTHKAIDDYENARYKFWYETWQEYLKAQKEAVKSVIKVDLTNQPYKDVYIRKLGKRQLSFTYSKDYAKTIKEPIAVIQDKLRYFNVTNIRLEAV